MTSSRLPGKVLRPILGRPMLALQLERLTRCQSLDALVVATSTDASDDGIAALCGAWGLKCFRGSLDDVLDRYYQAASELRPEHVVRLTGDCPLTDPSLVDGMVRFCLEGEWDYVSNTLRPTFPHGLDAEVMRFAALAQAWSDAQDAYEREHVTPFIYRHPERFRVGHYCQEQDLSGLRWTVDEAEDFELVSRIYEALYPSRPDFTTADILQLVAAHPELNQINATHRRERGLPE